MSEIIWCSADDFDAVLRQEKRGAKVIGIPHHDFISLSVAGALGDEGEIYRLKSEVERIKEGVATGPEQNSDGT